MSTPALTAAATAPAYESVMWYAVCSSRTSFQSLITTPLKSHSSRSRSVSSQREPVAGMPLTAPELTITVSAPASTAALYGGRIVSWR